MHTRSVYGLPILYAGMLSSATSTAVPTAYDMGDYFPAGKRSVKFCVGITNGTTSLGGAVTLTLEECASTATASFTTILGPDGSSGTWTSTANASTAFEWHGVVNYRYIRAKYVGTTSTGDHLGIVVFALPIVRNA